METMLEGKCGSCIWFCSYFPGREEKVAYDILSGGGRLPVLRCDNPESGKGYVSMTSSCEKYSKKES